MELFLNMIKESVQNAKADAKIVELRLQGKDHATLIGADESLYLKVAVIYNE
jgi:23S rRNA G2069 N7-methylase RlmK/C1962 C5-methylase RlmI